MNSEMVLNWVLPVSYFLVGLATAVAAVRRLMRQGMTFDSRVWEVKLLEVNPFFEMTDPCMFAWKDGFDGSFRFNKS